MQRSLDILKQPVPVITVLLLQLYQILLNQINMSYHELNDILIYWLKCDRNLAGNQIQYLKEDVFEKEISLQIL